MDGITFKSSDHTMIVPTCFFEAHPEQLAKLMSTFFGLRPVAKPQGNSKEAIDGDGNQKNNEEFQQKVTRMISKHHGANKSVESIVTGLDKMKKMQEEFDELKTSLIRLLPGNSGNGDLEKDKESRKEVRTTSVVIVNESIEPNNDDFINDDQEKEEVSIDFYVRKDIEQDKLYETDLSYDSDA